MSINKQKILVNNIDFYKRNINVFLDNRPECEVVFKTLHNAVVSYTFVGRDAKSDSPFEFQNTLVAFNSAIVLNCFSWFEASFENHLLQELDASNLTPIQEQVMNRYIDEVVTLSSEGRYAQEFKFITGQTIREFLGEDDNREYTLIKHFYSLRHLLIHGSATKRVWIPFGINNNAKIEMDVEDKDFQKLIAFVKQVHPVDIPGNLFSVNLLLLDNKIIDKLINSVKIVCNRFDKSTLKFIKDNPLKNSES